MDISYYNKEVKDELYGAKSYILTAIHCKQERKAWADKYATMSKQELEHAKTLMSIFSDDLKMEVNGGTHSEDYKELAHSLQELMTDMYNEELKTVQGLHAKYESM